jgi:hypothetical protein
MHDHFDPHLAWLGIPPEEQPVDYYRLLGVPQFESDREVIRKASDARMTLVKDHKSGPHARVAQKVASQISKATSCLLNPYRKGLYDKYLRARLADPSHAGVVWPPNDTDLSHEMQDSFEIVSEPPTAIQMLRERAQRLAAARSGRLAVAALVLAVLAAGIVAYTMWPSSGTSTTAVPVAPLPNAVGQAAATTRAELLRTETAIPAEQPKVESLSPAPNQQPAAPTSAPNKPDPGTAAHAPAPVSVADGPTANPAPASTQPSAGSVSAGAEQPTQPAVPVVTPDLPAAPGSVPTSETSDTKPGKPLPNGAIARHRPPAAAEQEAAVRRVREVLAEEFAAVKRPADHLALSDKLIGLARDSGNDSAAQFALYGESREQAILGADYAKALAISQQLAAAFDVDVLQEKALTIAHAGEEARLSADRKQLALAAQALVPDFLREGRFELANDVAQVAVSAATRARDPELGKAMRQLRDQVSQARRKWSEAEQVAEQLRNDPNNAELHHRYGAFLCFDRGDWQNGLPHLAKGSDPLVRQAAAKDAKNPAQAEQQAEVADAWFTAAESVQREFQPAAHARFLFWARQALPGASGLTRVRLDSQIQAAEKKRAETGTKEVPSSILAAGAARRPSPPLPAFLPPESLRGLIGRLQVEGNDVGVLWKYASGLQLTDSAISQLLQQAGLVRGRVRMEFVGFLFMNMPTTVNVVHNGGTPEGGQAVLAIDGRVLGEVGGTKATKGVYKLELSPGEHRVKWVLAGGNLGVCVVQFQDATSGTPVPVYHSPALLATVRETPFRARINVNMIQN